MWPLTLLALAILSGALHRLTKGARRYRLDLLALVSGGAATMALVDSLHSYFEGGTLLDSSTEAAALSLIVVLAAVATWVIALALQRV